MYRTLTKYCHCSIHNVTNREKSGTGMQINNFLLILTFLLRGVSINQPSPLLVPTLCKQASITSLQTVSRLSEVFILAEIKSQIS